MLFQVLIKKKAAHGLEKLPESVRQVFYLLVNDLRESRLIRRDWRNFSSLGKDRYHCHLTYRYVACWTRVQSEIFIEVYYVGSREKAPY